MILKERYNLFLDDVRNVKDAYLYGEKMSLEEFSGIDRSKWAIVRDYDEFCKYIKTWGVPNSVSLDNDLHESAYALYADAVKTGFFDWKFADPKMGVHALIFLLNYCKKENKPIPKIYLHTANAYAREEMTRILGLEPSIEKKSGGGIIISG